MVYVGSIQMRKSLLTMTNWLLWLTFVGLLLLAVPYGVLVADHPNFIFIIGALGIWRYGVMALV
tara:strand:- start:17 stop:208 length:192 start_codon:yes stop_codon:yes gene_type:complete